MGVQSEAAAVEFNVHMKALAAKADLFLQERGYQVSQRNGQRISSARETSESAQDNAGTEVFVGKVPRDMFEDELLPFMERAGKVTKIRLMMDFSCSNRGFAFVKYSTSREAAMACRTLNQSIVRPDCAPVGVLQSFDNKRLYFGNLPAALTKAQLLKELNLYLPEVEDVNLPESSSDTKRFAFVTFKTHEAATQARRLLVPGNVKMFGRALTVDWAKPDAPPKHQQSMLPPANCHQEIDFNNNEPISGTILNAFTNNTSIMNVSPILAINKNTSNGNKVVRRQLRRPKPLVAISPRVNQTFDINCNSQQLSTSPGPSILGLKAKQMLETWMPLPCDDPDRVVTICNINPRLTNLNQLKCIFQLAGRLKVVEIGGSGIGSVTVTFETSDQAKILIETLILMPRCFEKVALPGQQLLPYRPHLSY